MFSKFEVALNKENCGIKTNFKTMATEAREKKERLMRLIREMDNEKNKFSISFCRRIV